MLEMDLFSKISKRTNDLFNELDKKLCNTNECYRYRLGVNGLGEVCFTDFRTMTHVMGNREAQKDIKKLLQEIK